MQVSEGLLYGYGIFETIKVVNREAQHLARHFQRMQASSLALGMNLDMDVTSFSCRVEQEIADEKLGSFALRLSLLKDADSYQLIITKRALTYTPEIYQQGFNLTLSSIQRNQSSPLVYHKTLNYLDNLLELNRVKAQGFNEVLFLNTQDYIAECATSNNFFIKDGALYTPRVESGILKGIMRDVVIEKCQSQRIDILEQDIGLEFLQQADEAFISNALMGIMPVVSIDNQRYTREVTDTLAKHFNGY
jgi:branched-subunit amino acid aminotransferase/4-amino-4-deoxychorismate lyase